jgi:hypothetical protein
MTIRFAAFAATAMLMIGCGSDPTSARIGDPEDPSFTIASRSVWAGGTIRVESEYFRTHSEGATLEVNGTALALVRVDDTSMDATLPSVRGGSWDVAVRVGDETYPAGQITARGFAEGRTLPPEASIVWDAYVTPVDGAPTVIGGNLAGDLAMVDLRSGSVGVIPGALDWHTLRGPGMTTTPGMWILRGAGGLERWAIDGTPHKVADISGSPATRQVAELASDRLLVTTNQAWYVFDRDQPGAPFTEVTSGGQFNDAYGLYLSVSAGRAVGRVTKAPLGVPVFDLPTGAVVYTAPFSSSAGVAFSPDGQQLGLAGALGVWPSSGTEQGVALLRASDGTVLASRDLSAAPFAVGFDPAGRWLLVGTSQPDAIGDQHPSLVVLDRTDLSVIATLDVPGDAPVCGAAQASCVGGTLAVDGDDVYLFNSFGGPAASWRFTLLDE